MALGHSSTLSTNGLVFCLDAMNPKSYPGSGNTWTDVVGGRQGTLNNSPTFNGSYFTFNGTNQNVVFPSSIEVTTAGFTMGFLMRVFSTQNGTGWNFMLADKDTGQGSFEVGIYGNSNYNFIFKDNEAVPQTVGGFFGTEWRYMVFGMGSDAIPFVYTDGEFTNQSSSTFTSAILDFTQLFSYANVGYFKCDCSYIHLYDRGLSAEEISQNFEALRGRFGI